MEKPSYKTSGLVSRYDEASIRSAVGRRSIHGGVSALRSDRIQFDFEFDGVRYRPTLKRSPTEANLKRARKQLVEIRQRIAASTFVFAEEFPDYRFIKNVAAPQKRRTCDQVFDEFLMACDSRVTKRDLAFVTAQGYRKLLAQIWRPEIGPRIFDEIRYSELAKIANAYQWSKKTYNNAISVVRCAFDYGYLDHPEKHNPASGLTCLRMTKKDRPAVAPFTIQEAETLIARLHTDWGEAIGNYGEFRFFTGLRPSEQIALFVTDYDARRAVLSVTKARVLRRDKDRTKTQEDRDVELCPRALEVLRRQLALREEYIAAGKIRHQHLFFLEDGRPISDPEITRWRWSESINALDIRRRGPYHARHSSVTWQLMLGKNLLWVAKQHGHSVEVMLRMYAAWLEGATDADIRAIKEAMERRPAARAAIPGACPVIFAVNAGTNRARLIAIRPLQSPEFGSSLAVGKDLSDSSLRNPSKIKWRRGWDSNPRAGITRPSDFESAPL
jgi:integrase